MISLNLKNLASGIGLVSMLGIRSLDLTDWMSIDPFSTYSIKCQ